MRASSTAPLALLLAGSALATTPALGQTLPQAAAPQADAGEGQAQDGNAIVVTATRRAEKITDVPYNISAISADALTKGNVTDISALTRRVPGIAYIDRGPRDAGVNNNIVIRGIGTGAAGGLGPASASADTVSTYIGESPLYVNMAIKDVQRVEVLRGPQGTLYGSGSLGGTIRFIFNKPDFKALTADVAVSGSATVKGSPSASADATVNIPLSPIAALRLTGSYERQGGYVNQRALYRRTSDTGAAVNSNPADVVNGAPVTYQRNDTNWANIYFARAALRVQPSAAVDLQLNYQFQHNSVGDSGAVNPGYNGNGRYDASNVVTQPLQSDTHLVDFDASLDFGFASLTSATTYYNSDVTARRDNTPLALSTVATGGYGIFYAGSPRFIDETQERNKSHGVVQELRLTSNGNTPIQYVVGGFYQNTYRRMVLGDYMPGYTDWRVAEGTNPFGGALPAGFSMPGDLDFLTDETQRFREFALFGEVTWNITDKWQITGGARQFWQRFVDQASFVLPQTEALFGPGSGSALGNGYSSTADHIFKADTSYSIRRGLKVYATFSQGFRRGGANALPIVGPFGERAALNTYQPDKINNYELGLKGDLGRALNFSIAAFHIDWSNIQLGVQTAAAAQPFVTNGGSAVSNGVELEANATLARGLTASLGYSYADAHLTRDFTVRTLSLATGDLQGAVAAAGLAGTQTPGTPRHSATLAVDYRHELTGERALLFHIDGNYRSRVLRNLVSDTQPAYYIDGFSLWNPSISYETPRWTGTLFASNVFNAKGIAAVSGTTPATVSNQRSFFISRPLTVGLRLAMKLGQGNTNK